MDRTLSRRHALAALGATSSAIAGCLGFGSDGGGNGSLDTDGEPDTPEDDTDGTGPSWPAIDDGEVISDFEDLDRWEVQYGRVEPAPNEALTGTQAALVENDGPNGRD